MSATKTTAPRKPRAFTGWMNSPIHKEGPVVWRKKRWADDECIRVRVTPLPAKSAVNPKPSRAVLLAAIRWSLGEAGSDFGPRPEGAGAYWWRTELRRRAGLLLPAKSANGGRK